MIIIFLSNLKNNFILQEQGINQGDIVKLSDAGFKTVEAVMYCTRKALIGVKGIGENKIDKIIDAGKTNDFFK